MIGTHYFGANQFSPKISAGFPPPRPVRERAARVHHIEEMFTMFTTFTNLGESTRESNICHVTDLDKTSCPPSAALSANRLVPDGSPRRGTKIFRCSLA